jgi:signal transduction histidine kinase
VEAPRLNSLLVRLLYAYLLPTLTLFFLFGWLAYRVAERALDDSLGRRLLGLAEAASTQIRPEEVLFLSVGDDNSRTSLRLKHKLRELMKRTQLARIFVLDQQLHSHLDTALGGRIGDLHYHAEADRLELQRVFATRRGASSVLFVGNDGRRYKTGYVPIVQGEQVVAALGVEGSAEFYTGLARLRTYLLLSGASLALLVSLASLFLARRITRPLRQLAREASRIGAGDLERPIAVVSSDEVGLLAATLNDMRQDLFQRDQQMQLMLSGIAHEVRNPLGGIELFSGLLREDLQDDAEKLQYVGRIERELGYLKKVVSDFLDYARRVPPTLQPRDLTLLTTEVCELLHKDAAEQGVTLVRAANQSTVAYVDEEQLRRVVINLVRNAIQATPSGGTVTLRCGVRGKDTFLEIADTGDGIAEEHLERIFAPFFTTREKGTGLGLALAKKIVDDHGGKLTVETAPGQGSTFCISLYQGEGDGNDSDH